MVLAIFSDQTLTISCSSVPESKLCITSAIATWFILFFCVARVVEPFQVVNNIVVRANGVSPRNDRMREIAVTRHH